ncbi:flavodoxin [Aureimonas endophytica]|uniref:Flavodoxin n=1 Tax=Aureimonas endophytica TaxID=2027858 RepID=A0A916ZM29_9HYPH|nr:flavodoxin [Aureimonas endophytica]GGE02947.1 flavodoxin [Aureimonas endophytica]
MKPTTTLSRRQALKGTLGLSLAAREVASVIEARAATSTAGPSTLVAYFSRTGNTRLIATQIARACGARLFRIEPREAYPEDYEEQVEQAEDERRRGLLPPLQASVSDFDAFDTVYLGIPIWGTTALSVVRSFLRTHDISGKTLVPFITHGGYGLGNSLAVVAEHVPGARLLDAFSKQCDQEFQTLREVTEWLQAAGTGR